MPMRQASVRLILLSSLILIAGSAGCVRRMVTINTDPQGARVTLNDEEIGTSPVSVDFIWYGDYDVILHKSGYETLHTHHKLLAPWYQVPPIDFVAEALVPFTIHDRREMFFTLEPAKEINREQLLENAAGFRERTLFAEE